MHHDDSEWLDRYVISKATKSGTVNRKNLGTRTFLLDRAACHSRE